VTGSSVPGGVRGMILRSSMHIKYSIKTAIGSLRANTSRSALTILGIVIGITAITLVVSVGEGAQALILSQIEAFGPTLLDVNPGREPSGLSDFAEIFSDSLKQRDLEALRDPNNVQGVERVMPTVLQTDTVSYGGETYRTSIVGSDPYFAEVFDMYPEEGANFTEGDVEARAGVAVIGSKVKEELFGDSDALGKKLRIKNRTFRIVGVFSHRGQMAFFNPDKLVLVPYTTAQQYLFGIDYFHSITVKAVSEDVVPRVQREVELTLRELHGIDDPAKDDFYVSTQADAAARIGSVTSILTALLVSVAAISLVVGGVGIMNIMLVSVAERTREIGLHKALGATPRDISRQFLLESVFLTAVGGVIGVILGFCFSFLASLVLGQVLSTGWKFAFSLPAALLGLSVAAAVGFVFGLYPARQAAKKSPIEALRYE